MQPQSQPSKPERTERVLQRSVSTISTGSDVTITPARFAKESEQEWRSPSFLKAFEGPDEEEVERGLGGGLADCLRRQEDEEEEFVMELGNSS